MVARLPGSADHFPCRCRDSRSAEGNRQEGMCWCLASAPLRVPFPWPDAAPIRGRIMRCLHRWAAVGPVLLAALTVPALYGPWQWTAVHASAGPDRPVQGASRERSRARDDDYSRGFRDGYVLGMREGCDKCCHMRTMRPMPPSPMPSVTPTPTASPTPMP